MKLPKNCPHCDSEMNGTPHSSYWIQRTELGYDSNDDDRIEDQILECCNCHTLFRVRWKLDSFTELMEKETT